MNMTTSRLTRAAGLSAVLSGLLFIFVQLIHPDENVAAVTTTAWTVTHSLTMCMAVLGLVGLSGIYLRQVRETGLLGLIGYLMFGLFFLVTTAFTFVEAFVLPPLAEDAPRFVQDFLGIFTGVPSDGSLVLEVFNPIGGALYLVGGVVFGIAVFRARTLQRWAGVLLAAGTVSTLAIPLLPHAVGRFLAVPVGLAVAWLGWSLWSEQRTPATESVPESRGSRLDRVAAQ